MNYDIDTQEGMRNAVGWTNDMLSTVKDGGVWMIPRSGTTVRVLSKALKTCVLHEALPDPGIRRVLIAGGWTLVPVKDAP